MSNGAGRRRAIVIGGSMSGLFAGLLLRQQGFEVEVYERVESELAGRGAGIVAQTVVAQTLRRWALRPPTSASRPRRGESWTCTAMSSARSRSRRTLTAWEGSIASCATAFRRNTITGRGG